MMNILPGLILLILLIRYAGILRLTIPVLYAPSQDSTIPTWSGASSPAQSKNAIIPGSGMALLSSH